MHANKRSRFESTVAGLQQRHGAQVLVPARAVDSRPAAIATGFSSLDALLELGGIPVNALSVLSGPCTSGKLTLAYKILSGAQGASFRRSPRASQPRTVVIIDLHNNTDPDYLDRCGIHLDFLLLARPRSLRQSFELVLDLVRSGQAHAILLDSLAGEQGDVNAARSVVALLPQLRQALVGSGCAVILLDQPYPFWQRWVQQLTGSSAAAYADLHLAVQHERFLEHAVQIYGYQASVKVLRNRWGRSGAAPIAIEFNGTVKARETL